MITHRIAVSEGDLLIEYSAVIEDEIPILPAIRCYKLGEEVFEADMEKWIYDILYPRIRFNFEDSPEQEHFDKEFPSFLEFRKLLDKLFLEIDGSELDPTYRALKWVQNMNHFRLELFFNNKEVSDYAKRKVLENISEYKNYYQDLEKEFNEIVL